MYVIGFYLIGFLFEEFFFQAIFVSNRMVDFNSVQNSRDCRADKSQIARSRIGPLQNEKQALFFVSNFRMFCFDQ